MVITGALTSTDPAEEVGRETLSRFDMQFQAAAYAALEILNGVGVTCVYCDHHDDFVVERHVNGTERFHFFQVKTKGKLNHQWSLSEVLAIKQRGQATDAQSLAKIKNSFIGKLLQHGLVFGDSCAEVTLLSNVHFEDLVIRIKEEFRSGKLEHKACKLLMDNFAEIFATSATPSLAEAQGTLSKLSLRPGVNYISDDRESFVSAARSAIYKYSEVDLDFYEITEIANNLLDLVFRRSKGSLATVGCEEIKSRAGIVLDDLLGVLSISPGAYRALLAGEGNNALKTASILQRVLAASGASSSMIEYASQQKVAWDIWLRDARHNHTTFDLEFLLQKIDELYTSWRRVGASFSDLQSLIASLSEDKAMKKFPTVDPGLIFGGVQAALVRSYSR